MKHVLIVSASAGTGHVRAGHALQAAFADAGGSDVVHEDVLELAPRWVRAAYGGGFELLASHAPRVWREVYRRSDGATHDDARWGAIAHRVMFREFRRLLESRPWSVCVCTHFLPAQLAAGHGHAPPFASVITDFSLHRYWVQSRVGHYFVATPEMARELRRRLPGATAVASGIPVDGSFGRHRDGAVEQRLARAALGLPHDGPVALVMGGGMGMGVDQYAHAALAADVPDLHVLAVCGRNMATRERLDVDAETDSRLRVFGYVDNIATMIAAADVVVTKPGGLTCSEALAVGRPLVLTRAIPGHEEANMGYLAAAGAAIAAPTGADVTRALTHLFANDDVLAGYARRARSAGAPDAADTIVSTVLRTFTRTEAA